jgi:2-polyprenyl-3-methyl-5-hydroxy-6-metoxy-1,4-benzoquinol methylase
MTSFSDADAAAAWDDGAAGFDTFIESGADHYRLHVHGPWLLEACRVERGEAALDLGSGQGYFTRALARAGAHVTGVELSPRLVMLAAEREAREPMGIEYHEMSAAAIAGQLPPASFDLVTACMSLQDMADVGAVLAGAAAVLRPSGRLVFSVPHPATDTPYRVWERDDAGRKASLKLDRYFETGATTCHWSMPRLAYHWSTPCWRHTLSQWFDLLTAAGFAVDFMREPRPTAAQVAAHPALDDCARMPYFLIVGCRLRGAAV